jgi:pSer/pThr/pTyr-binding forkhead associated (FHA) protein
VPGKGLPAARREAAARLHSDIPEPADGGPTTRSVLLREGVHLVGRGDDCRVWLPHLSVSRKHARVRIGPQGVSVEDLGSANGTWRGDERLEGDVAIRSGERIRFGDVVAWFDAI